MKKMFSNIQSPAYRLVMQTAKLNWQLILINLFTNVLGALLEGSTLGIIYLAIACVSEPNSATASESSSLEILRTIYSIFPFSSEQVFLLLVFIATALQICLSLSSYVNKVSMSYLSAKAQTHVTGKVFEQIMTFSYGCVSRYKVGDLVLFTNDAAIAVNRQIEEINNVIVSLSFSLVYLFIIVRLSPLLAVAATLLTLVVAFIQYKIVPRLRQVVEQVTKAQVDSAKYITENIQALRLLHTFGTQSVAVSAAAKLLKTTQKRLQKRAFVLYIPEPILGVMPMVSLALLASAAVFLQSSQNVNVVLPMLLTFLLSLQRLSGRLKGTVGATTLLVDNTSQMRRLESILNRQDKVFEHSGSDPFLGLDEDIEFQNVDLSYSNDDTLALEELSFRIPLNKITAIVGESGAGKSSLVDLLLGIYQPTSGQITVNGKDLNSYCAADWRRHIGVVSQDTFIFNNSIIENLRYGRPKATFDDVVEASKVAQAHGFIMDLPDGYETVVGERGYRLSGGQRQRIALSRALIKQPEFLILDEATSALDSESEGLIQQALDDFQKDRTVVVIAHRLSTIIKADQILVMGKGKLLESGSHKQLIDERGRYARYWHLQSKGVAA